MSLKIVSGGRLIRSTWDTKKQSNVEKDVTDLNLNYFDEECDIDPGVTFKDIMILIKPNTEVYTYLLTQGPWLKELIEEGFKDPIIDLNDEIQHLELFWLAELNNYEGPDVLSENVGFHGVGKNENWAIEFSSLNTLGHFEVKLNKEYTIYDVRNNKYSSDLPLLKAIKPFTFLQVIKGIFWEMSFGGGIENRNKFIEDLKNK